MPAPARGPSGRGERRVDEAGSAPHGCRGGARRPACSPAARARVVGTASPGAARAGRRPRAVSSRSPAPRHNPIDQLVRNALTDITTFWDAAYPRVLRQAVHARWPAATSRSTPGNIDERRLSRPPGSAAPAAPVDPEETEDNAFYNPQAATRSPTTARCCPGPGRPRRPGAPADRAGPRVRPRHAGPVRVRRGRQQHPGRDAGRLLRRLLDGWVSPGTPSTCAIRRPELDDVLSRLPAR